MSDKRFDLSSLRYARLAVPFGVSSDLEEWVDIRAHDQPPGTRHQQRPKRKVFAVVLAQPQASFAKNEIFPFTTFWNSRSADHIDFLFPGFPAGSFAQFDDVAFNEVVEWFEAHFDGFEWSGRTTMVLFASLPPSVGGLSSAIDRSAFVFFDLEGLIKDALLPEPRQFFESLIKLAKDHPGDDALWEFRNDVVDGTDGANVLESVTTALTDTLRKYIALPKGLGNSVKARRFLQVRNGR